MTDPTDEELLEFVARFVGWTELEWESEDDPPINDPELWGDTPEGLFDYKVPDYLHSVDAWLRDVWPKIDTDPQAWTRIAMLWFEEIGAWEVEAANASARDRCLALWRTLEGKLP